MTALKLTIHNHAFLSWRKPWPYASVLGVVGLFSVLNFSVLPAVTQTSSISVQPIAPEAKPGAATSELLAGFNVPGAPAQALDYVTHSYLTGPGTILGFAGDNIQVFEYPDAQTARQEAYAVFKRIPQLAAKSYFHIFLAGTLIGLYIGQNPVVLQITEKKMGPPLAAPLVQ